MRFEAVDSLTKISSAEWNALAARAGLYSSYEWLRTVESEVEAMPAGHCAYLVVRGTGQAVAGLPVYLVEQEGNEFYRPDAHFLVRGRTWTAGTRQGYQNAPLMAEGLTADERRQAIRLLLDGLTELASAEGAAHATFLFLTQGGFEELRVDERVTAPILNYAADAWLEAPGDGFEDYLESLPRKARWHVRREVARFQAAGLDTDLEDPTSLIDVITDLADRNNRKYGREMPLAELRETLIRQLAELGDRARLFVCRSKGDIVGVALGYVWGDWLYGRAAGFDYDRLPGAYEAFNLLVYQPLRYCYDAGLRGLHMGAGSQQAKGIRGARIEPLFSVLLPFDGGPVDDLLPAGSRHQVRQYWENEMRSLPRAFDTHQWDTALDLCGMASITARSGGVT